MLTKVNQLDQQYQRKLLEKDQPDTTMLTCHFFDATHEQPAQAAQIGMRDRFNQALPNVFPYRLPSTVSKMEPCEIRKALERVYGLGDPVV
ncbi:TPA: hypothetical protein N0F65_001006 [Lagenidium giganteum]|uniref:Uncharacterized protein n=1 Tax=Lagenidium giganteum TaxID=4803 RepID=A0AAV2YU88_9STRA|nr:TPA: hypothetical protein N0F65_001006 [Lagenidium giganteum]